MVTDQIARDGGPEPTAYDRGRHEAMRLRPFSSTYGVEKVYFKDIPIYPGTCLKCVFDDGEHTCAGNK